jgi:hypothetical protein
MPGAGTKAWGPKTIHYFMDQAGLRNCGLSNAECGLKRNHIQNPQYEIQSAICRPFPAAQRPMGLPSTLLPGFVHFRYPPDIDEPPREIPSLPKSVKH